MTDTTMTNKELVAMSVLIVATEIIVLVGAIRMSWLGQIILGVVVVGLAGLLGWSLWTMGRYVLRRVSP